MPPLLAICADCERRVLHQPRRARALAEALAGLIRHLQAHRRLAGLEVVRESCHRTCPLGRLCVTLHAQGRDVCHHLAPDDDPKAVALHLAGPRA